jgi:hypothetical protein
MEDELALKREKKRRKDKKTRELLTNANAYTMTNNMGSNNAGSNNTRCSNVFDCL